MVAAQRKAQDEAWRVICFTAEKGAVIISVNSFVCKTEGPIMVLAMCK